MIRFDTDDTLTGAKPAGLPADIWQIAGDLAAARVHDTFVTFFVAETADDLADGGPISEPVCCGGSLMTLIADGPFAAERRDLPEGTAVWIAPVTACGYKADVLLLPDSPWLPADLRRALDAARRHEGETHA